MRFDTTIDGIPCQCHVLYYRRAMPMHIYGSGMGDCHPPEDPEFEFEILDRNGYPAPWLEKHLTPDMEHDLLEEYIVMKQAEAYEDY